MLFLIRGINKIICMDKKDKETMHAYSSLLRHPESFYLDPTYNIERFAKDLKLNRTYASQFSNRVLGMPFRDLISKLRLKYALELMKDKEMKLCEIASSAGFGSDISFRRAFVKEFGYKPSKHNK